MKMESEMSDGVRSSSQLIATLQARKDTLEAKLHDKTQELKSLCIKEAELTGILPPEIPLEVGESPPPFRRRVGTSFTYPENLINNNTLKSKEEVTLATLELEYKIQKDIADAALGMANDGSLGKAVRRKHRQVYQKIQCRLMDLEKRLNLLRQNHGPSNKPQHLKQRKKPRPPLDNDAEYREHDPILHDEGISLSPLGPVHPELDSEVVCQRHWDLGSYTLGHPMTHDATNVPPRFSAVYSGAARPIIQDNKMMYHRHGPGGFYPHQYPSQHYPMLAAFTHPELEHLERRERLDQGHTLPGYWLRYETDRESFCYSTAPKTIQAHSMYPQASEDIVDTREATDAVSRHHSVGSGSDSASVQSCWHRERDRFGSLDRRKTHTASQSNSNPCLEDWGVEEQGLGPPCPSMSFYPPPVHAEVRESVPGLGGGGALLPSQTYPEHSLGMDNRGLIRTQSLGSMDTSASTVQSRGASSNDTRSVKDLQTHIQPSDTLSRKQKEKEWYETSLDCAPPSLASAPVQRSCPPSRRPSGHSLSEMKVINSGDMPILHRHGEVTPEILLSDRTSDASSNLSRSSSNVSSEHHPHYLQLQAKSQEVVGNENFDTVVPFESPKNHMVVQAGKWQPYREVTKPFEMADFYKYSTKFRKNGGSPGSVQMMQRPGETTIPSATSVPFSQTHINTGVTYHPTLHSSASLYPHPHLSPSSSSPTPQQKGIYQPLQPMTCQPVDPSNIAPSNTRNRVVSPNMSLEGRLVLGNGESLADAFSTEMLAWYQDQSVPRSATLRHVFGRRNSQQQQLRDLGDRPCHSNDSTAEPASADQQPQLHIRTQPQQPISRSPTAVRA